jgi:hypothetical protein
LPIFLITLIFRFFRIAHFTDYADLLICWFADLPILPICLFGYYYM